MRQRTDKIVHDVLCAGWRFGLRRASLSFVLCEGFRIMDGGVKDWVH
jgi:hypothetical protein